MMNRKQLGMKKPHIYFNKDTCRFHIEIIAFYLPTISSAKMNAAFNFCKKKNQILDLNERMYRSAK